MIHFWWNKNNQILQCVIEKWWDGLGYEVCYHHKFQVCLQLTVSDRALIFPSPLLSQLQGWPGFQKIKFFFSQINLFSFCARIEPKLNKLQKTVKIDKKSSKNPCFLVVFWSLLNFGSILAQKHTKCKYLSIVPFFCHPGHPWSCESSGVITTLISLFKIFQQQCHLVTFFNFPKWSLRLT